jgi:5'/3'-nucleotidase SurE
MRILITNDDSHRSPLLRLAVEYFSQFGDVSIVVPLHEQSWTGKCVSRFDPVHVQEIELFGRRAYTAAGRPADCVSLGVFNLFDSPPDLVVSGINAGFNMGLGFVLSSGTVGACLEANLAGVPAIALSQAFDVATRDEYIVDYLIPEGTMARFEAQIRAILDKAMAVLFADRLKERVLGHPITWNMNFPFNLSAPELVRYAPLGKARYGKCFEEEPGSMMPTRTFHHRALELIPDPTPDIDSALVRAGIGTLTPISLWTLAGDGHPEVVGEVISALNGV